MFKDLDFSNFFFSVMVYDAKQNICVCVFASKGEDILKRFFQGISWDTYFTLVLSCKLCPENFPLINPPLAISHVGQG